MSEYGRGQKLLECDGIDLARPVDRTPPRKMPILENMISVIDGTVTPRAGLGSAIATGPSGKSPWHSINELNDSSSGTLLWARVSGVGDRLCIEKSTAVGTITDLDGPYSGNPLSLTQLHPPDSPQPWIYVGDSLRMRKVDVTGAIKQIGLPPPGNAPDCLVSSAYYRVVDLMWATTGWTAALTATGPLLLSASVGAPVNTTTVAASPNEILGGGGFFCCIQPADPSNIGVNSILKILDTDFPPANENVLVLETHRGSTSFTISLILYESGSSGLCAITVSSSVREFEQNALLKITGASTSEYVRIRQVVPGVNGDLVLIVKTVATRVSGDAIQTVPSFVCIMNAPPAITGAIFSDGLRFSVTTTPANTPSTMSKTINLDLTGITDNTILGGNPIASTSNDWMTIRMRVDVPSAVSEIKLFLDVDSATNNFTRNYFFRTIDPNDLLPVLVDTQAALENRRQQLANRFVDYPTIATPYDGYGNYDSYVPNPPLKTKGGTILPDTPDDPNLANANIVDPTVLTNSERTQSSRSQGGTGVDQFASITFRLSEMQRVGEDTTRGLANIKAIRITLMCSANVLLDVAGWCIHGGFDPDISVADAGYSYRYRARDSSTGVVSDPSPPSRHTPRPSRQFVYVTAPAHPSPEADKLDFERFGGPIPGWRPLMTIDNPVSRTGDVILLDKVSNQTVLSGLEMGTADHRQLWPVQIKPISSPPGTTTTTLAGTLLYDSSAPFSLSLAPGTEITANGVQATLRRVISTSLVDLYENAGDGTHISWEINSPVLLAQPLPFFTHAISANRLVAAGDYRNPDVVYISRTDEFDSTIETLHFPIGNPSDPIQGLGYWNGSVYVFTLENLYRMEFLGVDPAGDLLVRFDRIPGAEGLALKWAFVVGDRLYWLAKSGILASAGGVAISLTDGDLYPLFPHEGLAGQAVNGFQPPDLSLSRQGKTRLEWGQKWLIFNYIDASGNPRVLAGREKAGSIGWWPWVYSVGTIHHFERGEGKQALLVGSNESTGKLYKAVMGQGDLGSAFSWKARTVSENMGDPRPRKQVGDTWVEVDSGGGSVVAQLYFDSAAVSGPSKTISGSSGTKQVVVVDINSGAGQFARDVAVDYSGSSSTDRPILYAWEPTWLDRPVDTFLEATDYEDGGMPGSKFVRGIWIDHDTFGASRSAVIQKDGNTTTAYTITGITSNGRSRQFFPFNPPFYAYTMRILPTDSASWMRFAWTWDADPAPDLSTESQAWSALGYDGLKYIQGVVIDADTEGASVSIRVDTDENAAAYTIAGVNHNGRAQKQYDFNPPILAHLVRLTPLSPARVWPVPPTRWVWEPEPELADYYLTQQTTHDIDEAWKVWRDGMIMLRSTGIARFRILDAATNAQLFSVDIPSTAGLRKPEYFPISCAKAEAVRYELTMLSGQCSLYRRDSWIRVRGWTSGEWVRAHPFGDESRITGARV